MYSQLQPRELALEWRNIKPEEKARYQAEFQADQIEYEKALSEWEARMIRENKEHLVRKTMLPKKPKAKSKLESPKNTSKPSESKPIKSKQAATPSIN